MVYEVVNMDVFVKKLQVKYSGPRCIKRLFYLSYTFYLKLFCLAYSKSQSKRMSPLYDLRQITYSILPLKVMNSSTKFNYGWPETPYSECRWNPPDSYLMSRGRSAIGKRYEFKSIGVKLEFYVWGPSDIVEKNQVVNQF